MKLRDEKGRPVDEHGILRPPFRSMGHRQEATKPPREEQVKEEVEPKVRREPKTFEPTILKKRQPNPIVAKLEAVEAKLQNLSSNFESLLMAITILDHKISSPRE